MTQSENISSLTKRYAPKSSLTNNMQPACHNWLPVSQPTASYTAGCRLHSTHGQLLAAGCASLSCSRIKAAFSLARTCSFSAVQCRQNSGFLLVSAALGARPQTRLRATPASLVSRATCSLDGNGRHNIQPTQHPGHRSARRARELLARALTSRARLEFASDVFRSN